MKLKLIIAAICLCTFSSLLAEVNYKVISSSRLNVRKTPSTTGTVLGTFKSGQEITVLSINEGWAKVEFNNTTGYVSSKYIAELPKQIVEEPKDEIIAAPATEYKPVYHSEEPVAVEYKEGNETDIITPLTFGHSLSDNFNLYLTVQGGFGWSNFLWNNGDVNGTMSYSGDIVAQLYFENTVSFIPANWYSELALGYDKRGAASFGMNYVHARVYPLGYRIPLSPVNIVVKGGVSLGFPLNDLETDLKSWNSYFQVGIGGGFQIEWKQFAIGCNLVYDFTRVSSLYDDHTLNNIAVLGTISYKFAKFGHK